MTTKCEYSCDLCHDTIPNYTSGIGIKWKYDAIDSTLISESEHHLCSPCCKRLRDLFDRLDREDRERSERATDD